MGREECPRRIAQLTSQVEALAAENARLRDAHGREAERIQLLLDVMRSVSAELELDALLPTIMDQISRAMQADRSSIFLIDGQTGECWSRVAQGMGLSDIRFPIGVGIAGHVAATGETLNIPDAYDDPRFNPEVDRRTGYRTRSILCVPMHDADGLRIGVLEVLNKRGGVFAEEDEELLSALSSQLVIALRNAGLHSATLRRSQQLAALLRATQSLMAGLGLQETLGRIAQEASHIAGTPHVKVLLLDREKQTLTPGAVLGAPLPPGFEVPLGTSYSGTVAATGKPLFVADTRDDPRSLLAQRDRDYGILSYLGLPIKVRDEAVGVLTFNTTAPHQYRQDELDYLASFADQAAIAIERARLFEEAARAEALRELTRLQSEFVSIASHEFRTPLAALVGFTELLLHGEGDHTDRHAWIETMHEEAVRLSHLVEELLDVARIQEGRLTLDYQPVDIRAAVERALAPIELQTTVHRFERRVGAALPAVLADQEKLVRVLSNLLSNAVNYSPAGGSITVTADCHDRVVRLSVADEGLGIPPDELPRLFGRFHRVQTSDRTDIRGTGLGLYITKQLVELQGGRIWVESPGLGRGSTFHVELPVAEARQDAA